MILSFFNFVALILCFMLVDLFYFKMHNNIALIFFFSIWFERRIENWENCNIEKSRMVGFV